MKKTQEYGALAAVLVLVLFLIVAFVALPQLSVQNLFQGQQAGVVGVQIAGSRTISLGSSVSQSQCFSGESDWFVGTSYPATCTFKWISSSSVSPTIYADADLPPLYNDQVQADYSIGNFVPLCSADNLISSSSQQCSQVNYENSAGQNFTAYIVPYQFSVDITIDSNSGTHISFKDITFVNEIQNFLWNNIPAGYQSVNQSTIYASIVSCSISSGSGSQDCSSANLQYANVNPSASGSQVELYTDSNLQNSIGACPVGGCSPPPSNSPFPDSLMTSQPVYFGVTLSSFGAYSCGTLGLSSCFPSVHLVIDAQTFLVGSYIKNSVNPVTQTQGGLGGGNNEGSNPLNWFNNPFNQFITEAIIIGILAVAALALIARYVPARK
ncbi:MAG: hypothetical protein M1587_09585 [Thaumarchaeota archaeon]|nr:hypothetical protein [Nitrososphaerota archaeon]